MQKSIYKAGLYFSLAAALSLFAFNNAALADDDSTLGTVGQIEVDNGDTDTDNGDVDTDNDDIERDYDDTDNDDIDDIDTDTDTDTDTDD